MLKKVVSLASRDMRDKEVDGWDYYYTSKEEIEKKKANGELMQFISFGGNDYAYEKSEFEGLDELVIFCGGSGTGKDTLIKELYAEKSEIWNELNTGMFFSLPETLELFVRYAKKEGINIHILHLFVDEKERLKRIITGSILDNEKLAEDYGLLDASSTIDFEIDDDLDTKIDLYPYGERKGMLIVNEKIEKIIEESKKRVLRDREKPFEPQVDVLKEKGLDITSFNLSNDDIHSASMRVKDFVIEERAKRMFITEEIMDEILIIEDFDYDNKVDNKNGLTTLLWSMSYFTENESNIHFDYVMLWTGPSFDNDDLIDWHSGSWSYSVKEGDEVVLKNNL